TRAPPSFPTRRSSDLFPTLLALGYPPVVANVSNNLGLVTGNVSGAYGYRRELRDQRGRVLKLGVASFIGAVTGGLLLLSLPPERSEEHTSELQSRENL